MTTLIFVYGTLKRGLANHYLIEDVENGLCIPRGNVTTAERFPLVIASTYNIPFMLHAPGQGHNVEGELYEVDEKRLQRLDALEEHPYLYERRGILLKSNKMAPDSVIHAEAYFLVKYRPELLNLPMLANYDGLLNGKKYVFPKDRRINTSRWWFEVHTGYTESDGHILEFDY